MNIFDEDSNLCIKFEALQCLVKYKHLCGTQISQLDVQVMTLVHANHKAKENQSNKTVVSVIIVSTSIGEMIMLLNHVTMVKL